MTPRSIARSKGRRAFGDDPEGYAAARPQYPEELYSHLAGRCGLSPASVVFEVGAGTGLATGRLLRFPVASLCAIEPDPRLAAYLRQSLPSEQGSWLEIVEAPFERVRLRASHYDLGIAATSFHWVDPKHGFAKVRMALKPGGWWAMWWTDYGAFREADAFQAATAHLFAAVPGSPSRSRDGGPPYAMNAEARMSDMTRGGLVDAEVKTWHSSRTYGTEDLVRLYRTFSPVRALGEEQREVFLRELASIADRDFSGRIERQFVTVLYTARRPE